MFKISTYDIQFTGIIMLKNRVDPYKTYVYGKYFSSGIVSLFNSKNKIYGH